MEAVGIDLRERERAGTDSPLDMIGSAAAEVGHDTKARGITVIGLPDMIAIVTIVDCRGTSIYFQQHTK